MSQTFAMMFKHPFFSVAITLIVIMMLSVGVLGQNDSNNIRQKAMSARRIKDKGPKGGKKQDKTKTKGSKCDKKEECMSLGYVRW